MHLEPSHRSRWGRRVAGFLAAGSLIGAAIPARVSASEPGTTMERGRAEAEPEAAGDEVEATLEAQDEPPPEPKTVDPAPGAEPTASEDPPSVAATTRSEHADEAASAAPGVSAARSLTEVPEPPATPFLYDPRALRALRTRDAGIALAVVGGVLGVGALLLHLVDPCEEVAGNDCRAERRRDAALGMGVPAGALFIAGVVTASIGQARAHRIALEIDASRRGAALGVRARF